MAIANVPSSRKVELVKVRGRNCQIQEDATTSFENLKAERNYWQEREFIIILVAFKWRYRSFIVKVHAALLLQ